MGKISFYFKKIQNETLLSLIKIFLRLAQRLMIESFFLVLAFPCVVCIRILGFFVKIRICRTDIGRIGGTFDAEWYLCKKNVFPLGINTIDLFYFSPGKVSNVQWLKMWERSSLPLITYNYFTSKIMGSIEKLNSIFPDSRAYEIPLQESWSLDKETVESILLSPKPFLFFTSEEEIRGKELLYQMGISEDKPFVCFHSRDSSYLNQTYPERDWGYHDYRDSHIQNYLDAAEELTLRGSNAIRVGSIVSKPIQCKNLQIIDYSTSTFQNDFLDVYLLSKCEFMICSETGLNIVPVVFRVPIVFVNWVLLQFIFVYHPGLIIPKKLFSHVLERYLTFKEILHSDIGGISDGLIFKQRKIEMIENTPEEIKAVVVEMVERMDGTWKDNKEDLELQQRFWDIFGSRRSRHPNFRIGSCFLRENEFLLE
jgi:putative glycosyltransferase (TIGR04372 family)